MRGENIEHRNSHDMAEQNIYFGQTYCSNAKFVPYNMSVALSVARTKCKSAWEILVETTRMWYAVDTSWEEEIMI